MSKLTSIGITVGLWLLVGIGWLTKLIEFETFIGSLVGITGIVYGLYTQYRTDKVIQEKDNQIESNQNTIKKLTNQNTKLSKMNTKLKNVNKVEKPKRKSRKTK